MRAFLLAAFCFTFSLTLNPQVAQAGEALVDVLKAKDFWNKAGKQGGRAWTDMERKQLVELKTASKEAVVRLRANKVLVDLANHGRCDAEHEAVALAGFRYLEARLKEAPVQKLCAEQSFTHYTVSAAKGGAVWFLIEHVEPGGFNGGLNLSWDAKKKGIAAMQSWGAVPAP